jgi:hypothetical protein
MEYIVFLGVMGLFLIILFIKGLLDKRRDRIRFITNIREKFGARRNKEYPAGRMDTIAGFFKRHPEDLCVDDITWNDLGMDEVYKRLNYTFSSAGDEYLYHLLRTPSIDESELDKRERYINNFIDNEKDRVDVAYAIAGLGYSGKYSIHDYIDNLDILGVRKNTLHYLSWVALFIAIGLIFYNPGVGAAAIAGVIVYNFVSYFKEKSQIDPYITSFSYIMRLLQTGDALEKLDHAVWNEEWEIIRSSKAKLNKFRRGSYIIMSSARMSASGNPLDMIFDYLRMCFHVDIIKFNNMLVEVRNHTEDIDVLVKAVGYLDSMLSIAAYRCSLNDFCVPGIGETLTLEEGRHPLLEDCVPNGIEVKRGVLLTGSNASGKSTFLKMVAINAIMAQSIHTVLAKSYSAPLFYIASSMALKDNIFDNESYYIVEIKSIKRILDRAKGDIPVLCFVDEVLRGTNTVERIAASTQILKSLAKSHVICFAATHDIELADLLAKYYDNYHFEEEIEDGDVKFSYMIKEGKATTRNAIKLLSVMGYDSSLVESAEKMSAGFLENGTWENVNYE